MFEHSLKPLTALGGDEAKINQIGSVTISEVVDFSLASVAQRNGKSKLFAAAVKKAFGFTLPKPGTSASKAGTTLIWASPDQWLAEAPTKTHEDIAAVLTEQFGDTASITEQTGGWVRFDVEGEQCVSVMERLCAVDTATMAKGAATRTVIEHIGVFLVCRTPQTSASIYGPRSSADSLHHALTTAAISIA